ncbi:zinc ABC transporter permease [Boudabousia liubingyangii]|uniref:Zinc ABC transporter permease n=1 Tax=Boudabousia liubingyangii TaxID=1921764 RepID=A0A1Q5PKR3_9ACTO|nr:metal ABC transporter permease [Boudabousia liubingyangii]OKL47220.1 zinc ABC transporter permease [Boudabousia liubingyangii]
MNTLWIIGANFGETSDRVSIWEMFTSYIYRTVTLGTTIIGACAGAVGVLLYLRKQSLITDVIGHSAIAGVMGAFAVATLWLDLDGRSMMVLTTGALISSGLAVFLSEWISRTSKLGQDAAMAICLALFYGLGITGLHLITHSRLPNRGGIKDYLFGNATSLSQEDVLIMAVLSLVVALVIALLWKELKVYIFDPLLATTQGFRGQVLTPVLLFCATVSIVMGVKAVGLILMIAFAIMPAAAARQWTRNLSSMLVLSALIGGASAFLGSYLAINAGRVPTGPVIVMILFGVFVLSLIFPAERSVVRRRLSRQRIRKTLGAGV